MPELPIPQTPPVFFGLQEHYGRSQVIDILGDMHEFNNIASQRHIDIQVVDPLTPNEQANNTGTTIHWYNNAIAFPNGSFTVTQSRDHWLDTSRVPQFIRESTVEVCHVGSRATVVPPTMDTDDDYLVLTAFYADTVNWLFDNGWEIGGSADANWGQLEEQNGVSFLWNSFRKDDINLIVTNSNEFFSKFRLAAAVCRRLNLANKHDRIMVHRAIMNGEEP